MNIAEIHIFTNYQVESKKWASLLNNSKITSIRMNDIIQRQRWSATDRFWSWFKMVLLVIPMVIIDDIIFGIFSSSPKVLNFQGRVQSFGISGNFQFLSGTFTQENLFSSMGPFLVIFMRIVSFGSIVTINDKLAIFNGLIFGPFQSSDWFS